MPGKNKPMMGHSPKKFEDQKGTGPGITMADVVKARKDGYEAKMMDVRAKMAMPKMEDENNFPKMAQDMASALVQKMDVAKMYKPTKYHDGPNMAHGDKPMMGHKPKMYGGDKKN
tara:strand:+ start:182 stop:526 length:345 start_codon:yes stop_codon:yes gene_type:complete